MNNLQLRQLGAQKNKLLRYQKVLNYYNEHHTEHSNTFKFWKLEIWPNFHICRTTFYTILGTPVAKELKQIEEIEANQLSLF